MKALAERNNRAVNVQGGKRIHAKTQPNLTSSIIMAALVLAMIQVVLCATPERAYAIDLPYWSLTTVDGTPVTSGAAIDINLLQQGLVFTDTAEKGPWEGPDAMVHGWWGALGLYGICNDTGESAGELFSTEHRILSIDPTGTSHFYFYSLTPGYTYTLEIPFGYGNASLNQNILVDQVSLTFTVSDGSNGSSETSDETDPGNNSGGQPGQDDAGDPKGDGSEAAEVNDPTSSTTNQNADGKNTPTSENSSTSSVAEAQENALSANAATRSGSLSARSSQLALDHEKAAEENSTGEMSGGNADSLSTLFSGSSTSKGTLTGAALSDSGILYGMAGGKSGAPDGEASEPAQAAFDLVISNIPYLWLALGILFFGALPFGLTRRFAAFRLSRARTTTRLG